MKKSRIGIVMDPPHLLNVKKDSTIAFIEEAHKKNHEIFYLSPQALFVENGHFFAHAQALIPDLSVIEDASSIYSEKSWCTLQAPHLKPAAFFDVILMRKDPPFNMNYIYFTFMLEIAEKEGTLVLNKPQSLRNCNEKIYLTHFSSLTTDTLISSNYHELSQFIERCQKVVLKPLDGMAGHSIFFVAHHDINTKVILETMTQKYTVPIMAQKFIPEISQGDKRIMLIDGEAVSHCLARIPQEHEIRANLAVGGKGIAQPLSAHDISICQKLTTPFKALGLFWVGLDVIGNFITEINVTSPTGIRDIEAQSSAKISKMLVEAMEKKLMEHP